MTDCMNKKIIGLSCGRKNGNSEILLKEAMMGAEEILSGIETEIIRAMDLRIKPCRGCQACGGPGIDRKDMKCVIEDDDVEWVLEKTMVEDAALVISFPAYHLQINGHLKMITDRSNHIFIQKPEVLIKNRIGAIICVGGSGPDWTSLTLATANIYLQHTRILVDQMQVNYAPLSGDVVAMPNVLDRARILGRNVAHSMMLPIERIKYLGTQNDMECPVCHCSLLYVQTRLPEVYCPICWVRGGIYMDRNQMKVEWDEKDSKFPRFSPESHALHLEDGPKYREKLVKENKDRFENKSELVKKYISYGKIIKP